MLLVHGAGGNSAAMRPYAAHLSELGACVTVPDLPGYGRTTIAHPERVRYADWQQHMVDLVRQENDGRPLVLMGASMGGMLAYDAAAATGLASHLIVTCLLDPREPGVRALHTCERGGPFGEGAAPFGVEVSRRDQCPVSPDDARRLPPWCHRFRARPFSRTAAPSSAGAGSP